MKNFWLIVGLCLGVVTCHAESTPSVSELPPAATPHEIKVGDAAAKELEAKVHLLDPTKPANSVLLQSLNKMALELGRRSLRPKISYQVKVIADPDVNAFTLPNGHIYLYQGLVKLAASDDELAAVIGHEIGHNAMMHALRSEAKDRKLSWVSLGALLAAVMARSQAVGDLTQFSQYILVAVMSGYSQEYEMEADHACVLEMAGSPWNPAAAVTLMQRLLQEENSHPEQDPGIFRTHPPTTQRVDAILATLQQQHLPYNPRDVLGREAITTRMLPDRTEVVRGNLVLARYRIDPADPARARQAALSSAQVINELWKQNLKLHEIQVQGDAQAASLVARGTTLESISVADAALDHHTPLEAAQLRRDAFVQLFWREELSGAP